MAIEEMILLNMTFDKPSLDDVLLKLKETKNFYPQNASKFVNNVKGVHTLSNDNEYTKLLDRLIQVSSDMKLELSDTFDSTQAIDVNKQNEYINSLEEQIKQIKGVQDQLIQEKEENEVTLEMLDKISLSSVDLDQILESHYITVRFGRIKRGNLDSLQYYDGKPFIFKKLGDDHQYIWCCYIVTTSKVLEVDNIFKALGFEEIKIPSFVHGTIEQAKEELKNEIHAMEEYILQVDQKLSVLRETHKLDLLKLYSSVRFYKRIEDYKVFVVDYESKCAIYGFISRRILDSFKEIFKEFNAMQFQELPANILEDQSVVSPTIVKNLKLVEPFEIMSKVKQSDKVDVTIAYAILYYLVCLLFIGDIGIGIVLLLLGLMMRKKKMGTLLLCIGVASLLGGLIYGKAFYSIDLYQAINYSPLYRVINGIVLIGVGTYTIQTVKNMLGKDMIDKLLSVQGACGLIVIYSIAAYVGCIYEAHMSLPMMPFVIVVVASLILVMMKSFIKRKTH